ncbi:ribose transport system substrate-binding protein [Lachnospiraceae bacterium PF1-21]|uniref:ABC transporter substrate-binding protein n=1 Tax=Ohessyouella blattaphilus TaxID=2949333 RepID=UPI003E1DFD91
MKKILTLLLAAIMIASLVACSGPSTDSESTDEGSKEISAKSDKDNGFVVGFSNGYWGNTWRAQMVEDFEKRADEYVADGTLSDYMVSNTNSDATEQLNQINAMIDAGVDALLIDAVSPTTIKAAVEKAQKAGILVVIANDPAAYEGTICVCGDNYSWQKIQAIWLAEQLNGKGDIVEISGVSGNSADTLRMNANNDVLADYPDIKILGSAPGNWSETDAQSVMTTFLSSYNNIDAVLAQDVMGEGILKAYENAGKDVPIMTGDYTKAFINKWAELPELNTIGVSYAPGNSVTPLDVTIRLLQGKTIKEELLVANPMDENMKNTILLDPPYVVTREGDQDAPWMEGLKGTKAITLEEAIELLKDSAETAALDGWLTQEDVDQFFE